MTAGSPWWSPTSPATAWRGLRMALVKSALTLLVEDRIAAPAILVRLHRLLRSKPGKRSFATASLSVFDPATGRLELTNAGHTPA